MNKISVAATAGVVVVLSSALVGCGASAKTEPSAASSASTTSASSAATTSAAAAGARQTINDYITANNIAETPIKPDDPGTPNFDFPFPPGWSPAGDRKPDWAYGAIVYDKPVDPDDPPIMYAIASKLTGNVDAAKILELAPTQLTDLPDFKPLAEPKKVSLSGFDAIQYAGTYSRDGKQRIVAQKTVVIPGNGALFVLQLNADSLDGQQDVIIDAANLIDEQTKITPPA